MKLERTRFQVDFCFRLVESGFEVRIDALKCTVCAAAHSSSPKATSALRNRAFVRVFTFQPQSVSAKQRLVAFSLSVRPPPAELDARARACGAYGGVFWESDRAGECLRPPQYLFLTHGVRSPTLDLPV
jgi:hypothetical protein